MSGDHAADPVPADRWEMVDDEFWLARAATSLASGPAQRTEAAKSLVSSLAWLWTVYTGTAVLGALTTEATLSGTRSWLLALPSLVIVSAYATAVYASMPLTEAFDPRDPHEIQTAYHRASVRGWRRLRVALGLAFVAALSISAALLAVVTAR